MNLLIGLLKITYYRSKTLNKILKSKENDTNLRKQNKAPVNEVFNNK